MNDNEIEVSALIKRSDDDQEHPNHCLLMN